MTIGRDDFFFRKWLYNGCVNMPRCRRIENNNNIPDLYKSLTSSKSSKITDIINGVCPRAFGRLTSQ